MNEKMRRPMRIPGHLPDPPDDVDIFCHNCPDDEYECRKNCIKLKEFIDSYEKETEK